MNKKKIVAGIVLFAIVSLTTWWVLSQSQPIVVSRSVIDSSRMSVVVPSRSSAGTITQQPQYVAEKNIVLSTYRVHDHTITISQQTKPKDISLDQIDAQERFVAPIGTVYVLKSAPGIHQSIVETSDSWVYVTTSAELSYPLYKQFITSLLSTT